ncbi:pancreatic secretory granule membrane major glycoprotein GP2-like [Protopterus annectens]|uniref:pancreatic secretory granule membrane major glycoprotein GP2-like n=1 Tax=Protopterus annectens TaxID=7888 RepID=UPI001CF989E4|nr:pancreatic secretory granule membrane major glycoprotein GP2-like [Protopterus annectens]
MIGSNFLLPDDDIQDNPCFNNTFSPEHGIATYVFTFGSANPNCTTAATVNGTHVTYSLDVLFKYNTTGLDIILYNSINVNFVCSYPLQMDANLDVGVIPVISTNTITVAGSGTYVTTMQLYKYSNYTGAYTVNDMPISLTVESPLYIGASVLGADPSKFACKVQSCYATPTQDSNDPVKYLIISEGCPIPGSTGVHFDIDGTELLIHFYIKLFKFTTSEKVYLHCTFDLCSGTCEPSCNTRTAETDNTLGSTQLDSGPFKLVGSGVMQGQPTYTAADNTAADTTAIMEAVITYYAVLFGRSWQNLQEQTALWDDLVNRVNILSHHGRTYDQGCNMQSMHKECDRVQQNAMPAVLIPSSRML